MFLQIPNKSGTAAAADAVSAPCQSGVNDEKSTFRKNFQISRPRTAPRAGRGLGEPDRDNLGRGQRTPTTALEHFYGANGFVGCLWCFGGSFLWFFSYFSPHFKLFLSSPIIVFYYLRLSFVPQTGTRLSRKQLWMLCPVTNARGKSQAGFISKITDTKKNLGKSLCSAAISQEFSSILCAGPRGPEKKSPWRPQPRGKSRLSPECARLGNEI